jgi:hypothetical protein
MCVPFYSDDLVQPSSLAFFFFFFRCAQLTKRENKLIVEKEEQRVLLAVAAIGNRTGGIFNLQHLTVIQPFIRTTGNLLRAYRDHGILQLHVQVSQQTEHTKREDAHHLQKIPPTETTTTRSARCQAG